MRSIAGTVAIIKKIVPDFENKFLHDNGTLNYQEVIERGRAFYADSAAANIKTVFTDYNLETDFREDLIAELFLRPAVAD